MNLNLNRESLCWTSPRSTVRAQGYRSVTQASKCQLKNRLTAAILVETVEWVKTRLLLIVSLERVTGLKIGVLHDCDPAGPGDKEERQLDLNYRSPADKGHSKLNNFCKALPLPTFHEHWCSLGHCNLWTFIIYAVQANQSTTISETSQSTPFDLCTYCHSFVFPVNQDSEGKGSFLQGEEEWTIVKRGNEGRSLLKSQTWFRAT